MSVELLAPAGNIDIARSAIMSGADAIYIGPSAFGARKSASNSMEDIGRLIDYAHLFDVKVYLTMNTILYDDELDNAYKLASRAEEIGADALIVQDMAYLEMGLHRIPLHASTQTFNFDLDRIKLVASSGFDRIVLERSMTLSEIKQVRASIPIEMECFIHGAMCVGYSGRCYLSQFLCGRSGNRGICSQACRSMYDIYSEDGKLIDKSSSILSVSDINFSKYIKDIIDAGVCSLKIEGRLKDESYVVNNVSYYNSILNSLSVERPSKGNITCSFTPNPRKSFSRGLGGEMFLINPRAKVGAPTKSLGEKLGVVNNIDGNIITIDSNHPGLHNGDGVSWISEHRQFGAYINGVNNKGILLSSSEDLKIGDVLYRNYDKTFTPSSKCVSRKLPVFLFIEADENKLKVATADNFVREYKYAFVQASNVELAKKNIISSFRKTGDSPFEVSDIELQLDKVPFIPSSSLNLFRRQFFNDYATFKMKNYLFSARKEKEDISAVFPTVLNFEWNVSNKLSRQFYLRHGVLNIEPAFELQDNLSGKEIMRTRHCIRRQYGLCPRVNKLVKEVSPLILKNNNKSIKATFDCRTCQMSLFAL